MEGRVTVILHGADTPLVYENAEALEDGDVLYVVVGGKRVARFTMADVRTWYLRA
jgi:hypothetical protein